MESKPRVVIVGAGFGGLAAARALKRAPVSVVMVDQFNYHTFQPLLYQVATAGLEPEEIAHAVRGIFHRQKNFDFRLGKVVGADLGRRALRLHDGCEVAWDYLILSAGASSNDFGVPGVKEHAHFLKSLTEAMALRSHVIEQFEAAAGDPALIGRGALNFVLVGGGPTGVEMAGALVELIDRVLVRDYPHLDVSRSRVTLIEMTDRLLAPFHEKSRRHALAVLERRGVDVRLNEAVVEALPGGVRLKSGGTIPTRTLIWAAGVRANPLAGFLGLEQVRGGRVKVNPDLSAPGHPEVFVIGDMAGSTDPEGQLHPQLAQVAIQGGRHAVKQILRQIEGQPTREFVYHDPGVMATIGRNAGIAELPVLNLRFTGILGWLMWLFLHLMYLVGFRNRLNVFINWAYNYFTWDRSARLIIEPDLAGPAGERPAG
jgi:NADH:ubiquinone reductase (H+-translocating)